MRFKIVVLPAAKADLLSALEWYHNIAPTLAQRFESDVIHTLETIEEFPKLYPEIHPKFRRAILHGFPYGVIYRIHKERIDVIAIFHFKTDPKRTARIH